VAYYFGFFGGRVCRPAYRKWARSLEKESSYGYRASGSLFGYIPSPDVYLPHGAGKRKGN